MLKRVVKRVSSGLHSLPFPLACHRPLATITASRLLQKATFAATAISTSTACAFCSVPAFIVSRETNRSNDHDHDEIVLPKVVLYQYEPCPYCCQVKAVLDYLKIPYEVVEVNPITKSEIMAFTDYRKVPVVRINDQVVVDSSAIISRLWELVMCSEDKDIEHGEEEEKHWCQWVNKKLILLTPPNIYRTIPEALQAFDYCLTEGNFTSMERRMSKYAGAMVMYLIAKRAKKKYEIDDERLTLYSALKNWVDAIGDKRPFLGGQEPNMADLSVFGVLRAMHGLDTYNDIMRETDIAPWFTRMSLKVGPSSRIASN
ncbi:unnamed protein product [Peronospora belbahrii]|uniref:Prostaglandin E synthase 2 n=1 Tax=Peronospora belbahrii TaxID=622444 RepID=A0AAU9KQB7_9STRA|nr:unnamed protein product [Peronospora belbahrii]CAH0515586.1 unnamed protein product [Peronospora belbahrii]